MAHDTVVILCKTLEDARLADKTIPASVSFNRFFVFLGRRPKDVDLSWITSPDSHICIERALDWSREAEAIGVRAGLMYTTGWDLYFCWADKLPRYSEILLCRGYLQSESIVHGESVWGMRREHFVMHGLDKYPSNNTHSSDIVRPMDAETEEIYLGKALRGLPVPPNIAVKAVRELAAVSRMKGIWHPNDPHLNLIKQIVALGATDYSTPLSIVVASDTDDKEIEKLRRQIAPNGAVIKVSSHPASTMKPYKVVKVENGPEIQLYAKA